MIWGDTFSHFASHRHYSVEMWKTSLHDKIPHQGVTVKKNLLVSTIETEQIFYELI